MSKDNAGLFSAMVQAISNFKESLITSSQLQKFLDEKTQVINNMSDEERSQVGNRELIEYVTHHNEFNKVYSAYEKLQKDMSIYDFDDLIKKTVELFNKHPLILESYREKYRYILVDEFQDNNFGQYELIRLLGQDGNTMVVGDDDQLIMRFQGARESNFSEFQKQFSNAKIKKLTDNFRSTEKIVEFANLFVENLPDHFQKTINTKRTGEKVKVVRPNTDTAQIEFVINTIKDLIGKEYVNKYGEKAIYGYGDFAILSRLKADGRKFANAFKSFDIPCTTIGDYNIFNSSVISEVLLYIHIISSPNTTGMYLNKLMRMGGIDDSNIRIINEEADKISRNTTGGKIDNVISTMRNCDTLDITQKDQIKEIVQKVDDAIRECSASTVAETVYKIIYSDISGVYKKCSLFDSPENRLNILMLNKFWDMTLEFENLEPDQTLPEFQKHLKLLRSTDIDLEETSVLEDTVKVMTMHKAKGTEYPVVFVTDIVQYKYPPTRDVERKFYVKDDITQNQVSLNFSPATRENDYKRVLYVASTRAENLLYILAPIKYEGTKSVRTVSKFLLKMGNNQTSFDKLPELIEILPYEEKGLLVQGESLMHERIKTNIQRQLIGSVNKMQISTALDRLIELARVKYFEEHRQDDPSCSGFNPEDVVNFDINNLNFQVLEGKPKPLFNHSELSVSKSSLGTYEKCPYKFKLEKIQKTPTIDSAIALDLGTSVHDMIDGLIKDDPKKIPTKAEALKKLKEKWVFRAYPSKATENSHWERAEKMAENYLKWRKSNKNEVIMTEKGFGFDYEGVRITGFIDWVEKNENGEYEVVDFKSSTKADYPGQVENDPQLYIYGRAVKETKELGKYPVKGSLYFLEPDKQVPIKLDETKINQFFANNIKPMIERILDEDFEPTPGYVCGNCGYIDICEAGQSGEAKRKKQKEVKSDMSFFKQTKNDTSQVK